MARISRYDFDTSVSKEDKFIGTDSSGLSTKNFKLEDIGKFLNSASLISVNGQIVFKLISGNLFQGQFKANATNFNNVTSFEFSSVNVNNQDISDYLEFFDNQNILITQSDNQNNYGHYTLTNFTANTDSVTFTVAFLEGNGSLIQEKDYAMSFSTKGITDKNFVSELLNFNSSNNFTQTITHNLKKFPSVHVIDSGGSHVIGDVTHLNNNSFTITFKSTFSAKVHVN
tara:strand:+ start:1833 stop:2516 length:684 start_codon:yes stop_codon:yes gene_type:complete